MGPNNWMLGGNWLSSEGTTLSFRGIHLFNPRVDGFQAVESFLETGAQPVVRLNLVGKQCISSNIWDVKDIKEGGSGWLNLV